MRTATLKVVVLAVLATFVATAAAYAPSAPAGLSAYALDGRASLAWQPVAGADGYRVYRGASAASITTLVSPSAHTATTFTDTSAPNGTTSYYAVRAVFAGVETTSSLPVSATPRAATCSSGNRVVRENCLPGGIGWKIADPGPVSQGGIEGFATKTSINAGQSVDLKINAQNGAAYRVEVWRTGWYGGDQGRLVGTLDGLSGVAQPTCATGAGNTGLRDCSNWSTSATLTTNADWPSGVYLLRLVRPSTGGENHILLTVRDDASAADTVYNVPVSTYQAYNNYAGKSLYDYNSSGATTVAGTTRAVKVSYDRPYNIPYRDWYTTTDIASVGWFEREGYDVKYVTSLDLHTGVAGLNTRKALVNGVHDEYWSTQMRSAAKGARDAGVGLVWLGANAVYWKIRYEASPFSGDANRVEVAYKSTQSGGPDPSGDPTGTWRDPQGANDPENALVGIQYIGDNDFGYFPMRVSSAEGKHRFWRYTSLQNLPAGTTDTLGTYLVGWEWDARTANGREPAGVQTVASSPVNGSLLQDAGRVYAPGNATVHATVYKAASGATVFASGTNHWSRGLGYTMNNVGEPASVIMQATANALQDMGARPSTPVNITLDATGRPSITARTPAAGATGVATNTTVSATFDRPLDPATVSPSELTLTRVGGGAVAGTVSYDAATRRITLNPSAALAAGTQYTARVGTGLKGWNGEGLAAASTWTFTTAGTAGGPPTITSRAPADGATGIATSTTVRATFSRAMDPATLTGQTFTLTGPGGAIGASVAYDDATRTATLSPTGPLSLSTQYTARVTTGAKASDGTALAADSTWTFTTAASAPPAPVVTSSTPTGGATGVALTTTVRATFDRSLDPGTVTAQTVTLTGPSGPPLAASVAYDDASRTVTLTPGTSLDVGTTYTARLTTGIRSSAGTQLAADVTWSFTTADCPCSLMSGLTPARTGNAVRDGRGGTGPWTYELGTKFRVTSTMRATALKYYKSPGETGTHVGRLWNASGTQLASVTYSGETASGWQTATLSNPVTLTAGATYVVSIGLNTNYVFTEYGLQSELSAGPLRSIADGLNGVYAQAAGQFPTSSWHSSNYFADVVVSSTTTAPAPAPQVTATSPVDGATGVAAGSSVTATFSVALDPSTVNTTSFTLRTAGGSSVPAAVSYDAATQRARLVPSSPLDPSATYTARLGTEIRSAAGTPMASAVSWSFTTAAAPNAAPQVTSTSPVAGATNVSPSGAVRATFDIPLDATTVNTTTFRLEAPGGAAVAASVAYDAPTRTATLTPSAALAASTQYTAQLTTGIRSSGGTALASPVSWTFTTAGCPCRLWNASTTPARTALPTQDGRSGTGPWTYELGTKITVSQPVRLEALRFYKAPGETGTHVGRVWTAAGVQIASVTFTGESASGWQEQSLPTPVDLSPGQTYVVSVGFNAYFAMTQSGLATQITSGPLSSVVGANGVYGSAAGVFPTQSYSSSSYFVDPVVR